MAGSIFFTRENWSSRSSATFYVFEFLISRLPDGETKSRLQEYVDNNIAMLDLRDPAQSDLVDLIADGLSQHVESIETPEIRENLRVLLSNLVSLAKEQQALNKRSAGTQ